MGNTGANWQIINLSGTNNLFELGDGVTASTVHRIFCLGDGSITISAIGGGNFTWSAATSGQSIDIVPRETTVNSGAFIGIRSKTNPHQFRNSIPLP